MFAKVEDGVVEIWIEAIVAIEFGFHIFIVLSLPPLTKIPFVSTVNVLTQPVCPVNVEIKLADVTFHIFIVRSSLPLAKLPFCKTANEIT